MAKKIKCGPLLPGLLYIIKTTSEDHVIPGILQMPLKSRDVSEPGSRNKHAMYSLIKSGSEMTTWFRLEHKLNLTVFLHLSNITCSCRRPVASFSRGEG